MISIANKVQQQRVSHQHGSFFVIEGPHGCGKTTAASYLTTYVDSHRPDLGTLISTSEPGGTAVGEEFSRMMSGVTATGYQTHRESLTATAEFFGILMSRAQHVAQVIKPALQQGHVVVSDRFTPSTLIYNLPKVMVEMDVREGASTLLEYTQLEAAEYLSRQGIEPTVNFLLSVSDSVLQQRIERRGRGLRRYGSTPETIAEVNAAYHHLARSGNYGRWIIIDGALPLSQIVETIASHVTREVNGH